MAFYGTEFYNPGTQYSPHLLFFLMFTYFERGERQRGCVGQEQRQREGERQSQAGSMLSTEPDTTMR